MRRVNQWVDQLPWWQLAVPYFILMALVFASADYVAAWASGGVTAYDFGFNGAGHLSLPILTVSAGVFTSVVLLGRGWRRRRRRPSPEFPASR